MRGSVSAFALFATAGLAQAQDAPQTAPAAATPAQVAQAAPAAASLEAEQITVTGIRASLQNPWTSSATPTASSTRKRRGYRQDAGQDIADAVSRLPGVNTIQSAFRRLGRFRRE
ncbi:MAG: hypothetical protein WDN69_10910 [Aliidongia sp.]